MAQTITCGKCGQNTLVIENGKKPHCTNSRCR